MSDILIGRETTRKILQENPDNIKNMTKPELLEQYYKYYFYKRKNEMPYLIRDSPSFLELMTNNNQAVFENERIEKKKYGAFLKQSFSDAARSFHVIDNKSNGVIVPYGEGRDMARQLSETRNLSEVKQLQRKAQQFMVNLYDTQIDYLLRHGGLVEVIQDSGIYLLEGSFYDDHYGLKTDSVVDTLFL